MISGNGYTMNTATLRLLQPPPGGAGGPPGGGGMGPPPNGGGGMMYGGMGGDSIGTTDGVGLSGAYIYNAL